jgi:hypothetical protein
MGHQWVWIPSNRIRIWREISNGWRVISQIVFSSTSLEPLILLQTTSELFVSEYMRNHHISNTSRPVNADPIGYCSQYLRETRTIIRTSTFTRTATNNVPTTVPATTVVTSYYTSVVTVTIPATSSVTRTTYTTKPWTSTVTVTSTTTRWVTDPLGSMTGLTVKFSDLRKLLLLQSQLSSRYVRTFN